MTPASYGSFVPKMTGLAAPAGTVSSSTGAADAWVLFDKSSKTVSNVTGGTGAWVQYRLAGSAQKVCNAYWLQATGAAGAATDMPTQWEVQGSNDGVNWVTIDAQAGRNRLERLRAPLLRILQQGRVRISAMGL